MHFSFHLPHHPRLNQTTPPTWRALLLCATVNWRPGLRHNGTNVAHNCWPCVLTCAIVSDAGCIGVCVYVGPQKSQSPTTQNNQQRNVSPIGAAGIPVSTGASVYPRMTVQSVFVRWDSAVIYARWDWIYRYVVPLFRRLKFLFSVNGIWPRPRVVTVWISN